MKMKWKSNKNETNRTLGHFCAHTGWIGPGETPEAEHATSRSQRLHNTSWWGTNIFVSFKPRTLAWKAVVLTTTLGPSPVGYARPGKTEDGEMTQDSKLEPWVSEAVNATSTITILVKNVV